MKNIYLFILKFFARWNWPFHEWFLDRLSIRAFGGLHPKNIYNFRADFFKENLSQEDVVLDIACGTGRLLKIVAPQIKFGLGLDYSEQNIVLCQKEKTENISFLKGDILQFDYAKLIKEHHFTTAILSHILEHLEKPVPFLRQLSIKKLLICVPSQENWRAQLKKNLGVFYFSDKTHFREYTRAMLQEELQSAGYKVHWLGFNSEGEINAIAEKEI
jgi:SAM-dependent methyltransferase